jgi:hypothetical protein
MLETTKRLSETTSVVILKITLIKMSNLQCFYVGRYQKKSTKADKHMLVVFLTTKHVDSSYTSTTFFLS